MKNFGGRFRTGDNRFFARNDFGGSVQTCRHKKLRSDIAFTDVLLNSDGNWIDRIRIHESGVNFGAG